MTMATGLGTVGWNQSLKVDLKFSEEATSGPRKMIEKVIEWAAFIDKAGNQGDDTATLSRCDVTALDSEAKSDDGVCSPPDLRSATKAAVASFSKLCAQDRGQAMLALSSVTLIASTCRYFSEQGAIQRTQQL